MPPRDPTGMPPVAGMIFVIFWFLMMGVMMLGYIIALVIGWRLMRAHEKIAVKLSEIGEKL